MKPNNIALYVGGLILVGIVWYESRKKTGNAQALATLQKNTLNSSGAFQLTSAPIVTTLVAPMDSLTEAFDAAAGSF